jgi:hypothetical protein
MAAAKAYLFGSFRKEERCSMRVHLDRKWLDGEAVAFVVISLLIIIAFDDGCRAASGADSCNKGFMEQPVLVQSGR